MSFEDAMRRLDAIVEAMDSGKIGVEESIARYEEAMQLAAHCRQILERAEMQIRRVQTDHKGVPRVTPLDSSGDPSSS